MNAQIELIREDMVVVGCDGAIVGAVGAVLAHEFKLYEAMGALHAVPLGYIAYVDDKVRLAVTEAEVRRRWRPAN